MPGATATATTPPLVSCTGPDPFGYRRFHVDGREVVTVAEHGQMWRCDPAHQHGPMGGCSWVPIGEHLDGCGWVASGAEWHVYLTRSHGGGSYHRSLPDALVAAARLADGYTRCSRPVATRLCRLVKRHDGPCLPWS